MSPPLYVIYQIMLIIVFVYLVKLETFKQQVFYSPFVLIGGGDKRIAHYFALGKIVL